MAAILDRTHPESTRQGPTPEGGNPAQPVDRAWRIWERLRGWDQRYAMVVDTTIAIGLFLISTGWFAFAMVPHSDLWFVAGLTVPLILRRHAPIAVFLVVATVALVQWSVTGPLLADSALLVALYTVTAECDWIAVVVATLIVEIGVIIATARWTPVGNYFKSLVFLTGMTSAAVLAGVVVRALRSQMGWLAERAQRLEFERDQQADLAAATERARIAREMHDVVSHNIQVMVTLADAAAIAQRADPQRAAETMAEVSGTGRQALSDMRRMLGLLPRGGGGVGGGRSRWAGSAPFRRTCTAARSRRARRPGRAGALHRAGGTRRELGRTVCPVAGRWSHGLPDRPGVVDQCAQTRWVCPLGAGVALLRRPGSEGPDHRRRTFFIAATGRSPARLGSGHGLVGMRERAAAFGGMLVAGPLTGGGWQVAATLRGCKAPAPS